MIALEVGPGSGRYKFKPSVTVDYTPIFLDISPPSSDIPRDFMWIVSDAKYPPFRSECFDAILILYTL